MKPLNEVKTEMFLNDIHYTLEILLGGLGGVVKLSLIPKIQGALKPLTGPSL